MRAALLASGFYVAKGRGTGPKTETTIGLTPRAAVDRDGGELSHGRELLGEEWLAKWGRSDAQAPIGADPSDASWHQAVRAHPQFRPRLVLNAVLRHAGIPALRADLAPPHDADQADLE